MVVGGFDRSGLPCRRGARNRITAPPPPLQANKLPCVALLKSPAGSRLLWASYKKQAVLLAIVQAFELAAPLTASVTVERVSGSRVQFTTSCSMGAGKGAGEVVVDGKALALLPGGG